MIDSVPEAVQTPASRSVRATARTLFEGPRVLFLAMSLNNGAIFTFHALLSRILGPDRYGALGALLAITLLFNVATGAVVVAIVRSTASADHNVAWDLRRWARVTTVVAACVAVLSISGSPLLARYLHLRSIVPVLLLGAFLCAVLAQVPIRGVLLGQHRFGTVGASFALSAVTRLALGLALAPAFGISGGLAAYVLAESVGAAVLVRAHRRIVRTAPVRRSLDVAGRTLRLSALAYAGMYALSGADTFLARHLLLAHAAGLYVAASTAGAIALWLPYNVTTSSLPSLAGEAADASGGRRGFLGGLAVVALLTTVLVAAMEISRHLVVGVLFGPSFTAAAPILVLLAVSNGAQGVAGYLLHHQLAHQRRRALVPWLGLAGMAIGISAHHHSALQVATVAVLVSTTVLAVMAGGSFLLGRPRLVIPVT